jgi:pimeloyl-ACP methyl ester carboxylesterase
MSAVLLKDEVVHYEVLGRGRPLVFLHGWVGSWRYWIPAMQAASAAYRAYALDLWGFGDTAKNRRGYSLEGQLELLEEFLNQLGIGRIALVGHGLGAVIGLLFASRRPEAVDRLLVVGHPHREAALHPRLRTASPAELADWLLDRSPAAEPARIEAVKTDPQAVPAVLEDLRGRGLLDLPSQTKAACLLVYGANDPALPAPDPGLLKELPEHFHWIILDGCGHFPMLEEPGKFNRLMADFLSLPPGESPRQLQLKEEWKRRVR